MSFTTVPEPASKWEQYGATKPGATKDRCVA